MWWALMLAMVAQDGLQERVLREKTRVYMIEVRYPEIPKAGAFNRAVHDAVDPVVKRFQSQDVAEGLPEGAASGTLRSRYTAVSLRSGIISVLLDWSEYDPGAAHPWSAQVSVNYDSRAGRVLGLRDLFLPGSDSVRRLSELAIADLMKREYAVEDMVRQGAGPVESNFKVFTLTETALVLYFPQYQVAPGVVGNEKVEIPLATLAPLLRPR